MIICNQQKNDHIALRTNHELLSARETHTELTLLLKKSWLSICAKPINVKIEHRPPGAEGSSQVTSKLFPRSKTSPRLLH